ncbi:MAG TPA: bifunctional phosphopantothenoylcysteine decarboxylase/phosphopantothenate--cysteine ligase CoaBC [Pseudomonadales bacterium]
MTQRLSNRRILLGITGGIAAYKSADLVRRLRDHGAEVRVIMTRAATEFITPLTLQALSGNPVHLDLLDPAAEAAMGHIELARWADMLVIAPATANAMSRLAEGRADDLLSAVALATRAPIALAPAMNQAMWANAATQHSLETLQHRGLRILGPADGSQACGEIGTGRMLEPVEIAERIASCFESRALEGLRVVITAGPTREAIDPVRFISNHSSGRMGFALARAAAAAGAQTTLIAGPVHLTTPDRVQRNDVTSAADMLTAVEQALAHCDIFIGTAAVADYRPAAPAEQKIKKQAETLSLALIRNPDIISRVAQHQPKPFTVGFAAETERVLEHARSKLAAKKLDMIIANDVSAPGIGFESAENAVTIIHSRGEHPLDQMPKERLAIQIMDIIARTYYQQQAASATT